MPITSDLACSFCSKTFGQVEKIIVGPNVTICNECIDLCASIVRQENAGTPAPKTTFRRNAEVDAMPAQVLLKELGSVTTVGDIVTEYTALVRTHTPPLKLHTNK